MHALFGFDLDGVIIKDKAGAKCQANVAKLASKCQEAKLRAFSCVPALESGENPSVLEAPAISGRQTSESL